MIDSVSIVAIIAGCSALIVSVLAHIKRSKCMGLDITTTESHTPTIQTPEEHFNYGNRPPSPATLKLPEPSEPIPIPNVVTPLLLRKNYL